MLTIDPQPIDGPTPSKSISTDNVVLADGQQLSLVGMSFEELQALQWEQEQKFAAAIAASPKASEQRALITGQAYDAICAILAAQQEGDEPLIMGLDTRYVRLVQQLLGKQIRQGIGQPRLFEIGYGSGAMLKEAADCGFQVGGIEVCAHMRDEAIQVLGEGHKDRLLLGDVRDIDVDNLAGRPSLVYWNDVFEHICPDEIEDYLAKIYELLIPGGLLVTITPNWLLRPSDVTGDFCPARTEARGLHFKEYRLAEVTRLLKNTGFRRVTVPLFVTKRRMVLCGSGLRWGKQLFERGFDKLPVRLTHLLCRGFGMSCTIAVK